MAKYIIIAFTLSGLCVLVGIIVAANHDLYSRPPINQYPGAEQITAREPIESASEPSLEKPSLDENAAGAEEPAEVEAPAETETETASVRMFPLPQAGEDAVGETAVNDTGSDTMGSTPTESAAADSTGTDSTGTEITGTGTIATSNPDFSDPALNVPNRSIMTMTPPLPYSAGQETQEAFADPSATIPDVSYEEEPAEPAEVPEEATQQDPDLKKSAESEVPESSGEPESPDNTPKEITSVSPDATPERQVEQEPEPDAAPQSSARAEPKPERVAPQQQTVAPAQPAQPRPTQAQPAQAQPAQAQPAQAQPAQARTTQAPPSPTNSTRPERRKQRVIVLDDLPEYSPPQVETDFPERTSPGTYFERGQSQVLIGVYR